MLHGVRMGLVLLVAAAVGCGGSDTSRSGLLAAAARDSARKADSVKAVQASKTLKVTNVMIGKRISADNRITEPTFQFAPSDTVYISIGTVGRPASASLGAKWVVPNGQVMDSSTKTIQPKGADNTELHASPAKGWKPGTYLIKIYLGSDSVDAKTFAVRK